MSPISRGSDPATGRIARRDARVRTRGAREPALEHSRVGGSARGGGGGRDGPFCGTALPLSSDGSRIVVTGRDAGRARVDFFDLSRKTETRFMDRDDVDYSDRRRLCRPMGAVSSSGAGTRSAASFSRSPWMVAAASSASRAFLAFISRRHRFRPDGRYVAFMVHGHQDLRRHMGCGPRSQGRAKSPPLPGHHGLRDDCLPSPQTGTPSLTPPRNLEPARSTFVASPRETGRCVFQTTADWVPSGPATAVSSSTNLRTAPSSSWSRCPRTGA